MDAQSQTNGMDTVMNHALFEQLKRVGSPLLRPVKFAELTGIAKNTITTLMDRGELPVVILAPRMPGKRPTRYINMVALYQHCEREAKTWIS